MNPKEFIKNRLNELRNIFPELSFKYKYNPHTSTHIVDVRPLDCYQKNQDYIKYEAEFGFEFDNIFYPETILFVSEDSLTQISNPEFVFNACQFSEDLQKPMTVARICNIMEDNHFEFEHLFALAA
ncbi:MAG: hypothetical protein GYA51_03905 [Candidatus Methanofastidiosa archaeon]|nr:hypothetical protein [Candidatus Methanofastidiosa archaeon]